MSADEAPRKRARRAVLELLEQRHGFGARPSGTAAWVEARLDRALDALGEQRGLEAAVDLLREQPARLAEVAELLRVGETRFYRDPAQWDALRRSVIPALSGRERLRGLSVGCSSGEEAWTLAILLDEARSNTDVRSNGSWRVVGIDRSEVALAAARAAEYTEESARQLPAELSGRYLRASPRGLGVSDSLRQNVTFVRRDVMQGPPPGQWELVVCKNLFIYFGDEALARVGKSLLGALADGGVLIVARSEVPRVRALGRHADEIAPGVVAFRG